MTTRYDISAFKSALGDIRTEEHPKLVQQKSRDFYWYSPVLKRQLEDVTGDIVVSPKTEDEVIAAVAAAYAHDIPITVRGSGTGNYGQAMPLSGGAVLDVSGLNEIEAIDAGAVAVGSGAIISHIDDATRRDRGL
ncbi:MAG: FAD-binding protein, partial [Pseudomonadota bacterium]